MGVVILGRQFSFFSRILVVLMLGIAVADETESRSSRNCVCSGGMKSTPRDVINFFAWLRSFRCLKQVTHAHSNSSGAIPNINTTRVLEKKENWRPKMTTPIPLSIMHLSLSLQGSEEPKHQRNLRKLERGRYSTETRWRRRSPLFARACRASSRKSLSR